LLNIVDINTIKIHVKTAQRTLHVTSEWCRL